MEILFLIYAFLINSKFFQEHNYGVIQELGLACTDQYVTCCTCRVQTHPELCNFNIAFSDRQFLNNIKHKKENSSNVCRNFSCKKESARSGRILQTDNIEGGTVILHAVSAYSVLDFGFQVDSLACLHTVDHYA